MVVGFEPGVTPTFRTATFRLRGADGTDYVPRDFAYDARARTATWTLPSALGPGRLELEIDVDGDSDAESRRTFDVLPGDVDGGGAVNALDLADVRRRLGRRPNDGVSGAGGSYSVFADVTGNAQINALDLAAVRQRLNQRLSTVRPPEPAPAAAPAVNSLAGDSVRWSVLGNLASFVVS